MTRSLLTAVLAATLVAWSTGCASNRIEVSTSFDPIASFPAEATFVWDDAANIMPQDERLEPLHLDEMIRQGATDAFAARGYRPAEGDAGDFLLSYEFGESIWHGSEGMTSVASISLVLKHPETARRVWVGFARANVEPMLSREERGRRLRGAFDEMLEGFPPSESAR